MKINKVLLTQPNYSRFGKRSWRMHPYSLGIINACIKDEFETELFDPNFDNMDDAEVTRTLLNANPDLVGISTVSTEYIKEIEHMTQLVREALPGTIIVEGGVLPTVMINRAIKDKNVNYWVIGEGERRFPQLLDQLNGKASDFSKIDGLAYYYETEPVVNSPRGYVEDLDSVPFADYGNLDVMGYSNQELKYAQGARPRRRPYMTTMTSRGCPYRCIFCSGPRISGRRVRMRSAENVLEEIDKFHEKNIREIIFSDDHFLFNRQRAVNIMRGLVERQYDLLWKCANLTAWLLDGELLDLMKQSGCYQMTVSIESGDQYVLNKIVKKPIKLKTIPAILDTAKHMGFEIIVNFVIGFPGETWQQIRETFAFAEKLNADLINFHIATPLPNTELAEICMNEGYIPSDFFENATGYTKGTISTSEFTPQELQILRAFEWDRINFGSPQRRETIAQIQGITIEELEVWRKNTRRQLGIVDKYLVA